MTLLYGAFLFLFWILLSGHYDPLLLGLGIASVGLTVYLARRMDILDDESFPIHLISKLPVFFAYMLWEILKSNIDVLKRILSWDEKAVSPRMVELPLPQKTDLGRAMYANSITLTPGTVSVGLTKESVIVHALAKGMDDDLSTGAMARAIPEKVIET